MEVSLVDDKRRGWTSSTDTTLATSFKYIVDSDRQMTIRDICDVTEHSYGTVQHAQTKELTMRKISARSVPRLLTDHHRRNRVTASKKVLHHYRCNGTNFLGGIVTTDKTGLYLYHLQIKEQSRQELDSSYWTTQLIHRTLRRWMLGCFRLSSRLWKATGLIRFWECHTLCKCSVVATSATYFTVLRHAPLTW